MSGRRVLRSVAIACYGKRMSMRRDKIIKLAMEIGATRERLRRMEEELVQLVPDEDAAPASPAISDNGGDDSASIASRVVQLFGVHQGQQFGASVVAKKLGLKNPNSLRGTLHRLAKEGRIDRVDRGKYRARKEPRTMSP